MIKQIVGAFMLMVSAQGFSIELEGAKNFVPAKYLGTWYQIQSTNPIFQRDCKCVKAEYGQLSETTLSVLNSCYKQDGTVKTARGTARISDLARPSRLEVKIGPISLGGVNYVVTEVGEDYDYSVVVSPPSNSPIWILSREKVMDPALISRIRKGLIEAGVRVSNLKPVNLNECPNF